MSIFDVYREEQITVAQQTIYQMTDSFMLPVEERWQSREGNVRSEIRFAHQWQGVFLLECTRPFAVSLASLMLSTNRSDLSESDLTDVMGEVLNTIAGNLKCLLPADTELSIPVTTILPQNPHRTRSEPYKEHSKIVLESELGQLKLSLMHCN
ncbi:CheY-specific phosphatase CheX [Silvibacterium bohemicum]|uniref:CheY-specific phosphatase CheX n=1 Tax=Silvibacterium bohemicum TaxID=1577686 RepID=A0A841JZJ8_9BACT|nr:chemotaxis protein CheX [Silvibacterium bohemicum]MBB6146570.1 CheY-specific phosphatase CheX [Silvibacterium bohemicum]